MRSERIKKINGVISQYFESNQSVNIVAAKDMMPNFISAGIFNKDQKNGLPIRKILRELDDTNSLHLIPYVLPERKGTNTNWYFSRTVSAMAIISSHSATKREAQQNAKSARNARDEYYVIDLCDDLLGLTGSRQHRFDFLLGDSGTKLPVDVYYEKLKLVIEYNEQQHTKAVKHFDKPDRLTISGVHRGEQRRIYDKRKRTVLPQYGIEVVDIAYAAFQCDKRGKIKRDMVRDREIVKQYISNYL